MQSTKLPLKRGNTLKLKLSATNDLNSEIYKYIVLRY